MISLRPPDCKGPTRPISYVGYCGACQSPLPRYQQAAQCCSMCSPALHPPWRPQMLPSGGHTCNTQHTAQHGTASLSPPQHSARTYIDITAACKAALQAMPSRHILLVCKAAATQQVLQLSSPSSTTAHFTAAAAGPSPTHSWSQAYWRGPGGMRGKRSRLPRSSTRRRVLGSWPWWCRARSNTSCRGLGQ